MKKIFALLLTLVMTMGLMAGCTTDTSTNELNTIKAGKLIMSTNATFPPYEMIDDSGNVVGIDVEIAQAIADKLGLELVVDDMGFTACLEAVQRGSSDIAMAGITVSPEREAVMDFSNSYATGVQVVIVPENSDITSPDDLTGKKIGTQMGTTGFIYASDTPENGGYGEDMVVPYDSGITAVQALKNGQIDCVIIDSTTAKAYVAANPGLKILDTEWISENYAIGFAKGNTTLAEAVNKALDELIENGTVQQIIDKYISAQ